MNKLKVATKELVIISENGDVKLKFNNLLTEYILLKSGKRVKVELVEKDIFIDTKGRYLKIVHKKDKRIIRITDKDAKRLRDHWKEVLNWIDDKEAKRIVKLLSQKFKIKETQVSLLNKKAPKDSGDAYGEYTPLLGIEIWMADKKNDQQVRETIVHEMAHHIADQRGFDESAHGSNFQRIYKAARKYALREGLI